MKKSQQFSIMRRGQQKATRVPSPANVDSLMSSCDESFHIDSVVGKGDPSSASSTNGAKNASSSMTSPSSGAKSTASTKAQPSLSSDKGSLSKKKKSMALMAIKNGPRPLWLTAFYVFVTAGSLYGTFSDRTNNEPRKDKSHFRGTQYMIPSPDEFASLRRDWLNQTRPQSILSAPTNEYHLFHIAPVSNLGNNLLNSILMGMFDATDSFYAQVYYDSVLREFDTFHQSKKVAQCTVTVVSQTNETDILVLERSFSKIFHNIFFVALKSAKIPECVAPPENMICFDYNDMAYENHQGRTDVVQRVIDKLHAEWQYFSNVKFDLEQVFFRLEGMEKVIAEMMDKPFNEVHPKYGIHGQKPLEASGTAQVGVPGTAQVGVTASS